MPLSRSWWLTSLLVVAAWHDHGTEGYLALDRSYKQRWHRLPVLTTHVAVPVVGFQSIRPLNRSSVTSTPTVLYAVVPSDSAGPSKSNSNGSINSKHPRQSLSEPYVYGLRRTLRRLAELSLKDYQWRSDIFKSNEAERMLEESLARMRGSNPTYLRPMDADESRIGPLGRWEKSAVQWISQVIDEEGRRAEKIVSADGKLVRPKDAASDDELGPLGFLEKQVVDFIQSILNSEQERARTKTLRPKDLDAAFRGPLGEAELEAVRIFGDIQESERLRMQQTRKRGGAIVRPIDVPGPLGELEMKVSEFFYAEQKRAQERASNAGQIVRPKDARLRGPLGEAELQAYQTIQQLSLEEYERLKNIRRLMEEKRPMENDQNSLLGILETIIVGILRAPQMIMSTLQRVKELLDSELLGGTNASILKQQHNRLSKGSTSSSTSLESPSSKDTQQQ